MADPYTGPPSALQNAGAAINTATGNLPAHIQRLILMLRSTPTSLRAEPGSPEGIGGAQHRAKLDQQIAEAGG